MRLESVSPQEKKACKAKDKICQQKLSKRRHKKREKQNIKLNETQEANAEIV